MKCINCGGELKPFHKFFHKCENCDLFKNINYSSKEDLKVRLANFMLTASRKKEVEKIRLEKGKKQISVINNNYHKKGKVYDVAAAGGFFMKAAQDDGWIVSGNEVSSASIDWAKRNYDLDIKYGYFDDLEINDTFDAIVFWNSLEHMHNPLKCIEKSYDLLVDGGLIYIRVPNRNVKNLHKYVESLHSYEFNPKNLDEMLTKNKFEKIFIEQVDYEKAEAMDLLYKKVG